MSLPDSKSVSRLLSQKTGMTRWTGASNSLTSRANDMVKISVAGDSITDKAVES